MRNAILLIPTLVIFLLGGCGKMDVLHDPAEGIEDAPSVCIIKDRDTRDGFLEAMESWFEKENISYRVIPEDSRPDACKWCLRYYGHWSWDFAIFLSHAEIVAYRDSREVGREKLIVGQFDQNKFERGETRTHKMMDMLYEKAIHYEPTLKH